jgi:hypothetical protein
MAGLAGQDLLRVDGVGVRLGGRDILRDVSVLSPLSRTAAWRRTAPSPIPERAVACQQSPPPVRDKGVSS